MSLSKLLRVLVLMCIMLMASCAKESLTNPNSNINNSTGDTGGDNGSGGDNGNNGGDGSGGGDNGDNGTTDPEKPFVPSYPNDPGPSYGSVIEVVTPSIFFDNVVGTSWKVRVKDQTRINLIWRSIVKTFNNTTSGLGIVFGEALANIANDRFKNDPDLKNAKSTDRRLYHNVNSNTDLNFYQAFNKKSSVSQTLKPFKGELIKEYRHAVIVKIESDDKYYNNFMIGKYTIGGVYNNKYRLLYGIETYDHVAEVNDDEIMIIRSDIPWSVPGKQFYRVQLLYNPLHNGFPDRFETGKIYNSYYDFLYNGNQTPKYSDYMYVMKYSDTTELRN